MVNFLFGLLMGYVFGGVTYYFIFKIDKDIKNGRG
jgi:hypothetical protein